jgi:cytosine/adenosine deaminase-related metal-dependent hydrolase
VARVLRAKWILPVDRPPIDGGWIEIDDGHVARVGSGRPPATAEDLGEVAVLPGLVNAHTHLELGWLAGRVPPSSSMVDWIRTLIRERSIGPSDGEAGIVSGVERGIREARATGTVLVGDVSNTLATVQVLDANGFAGVVFYEILGFNPRDPDGLVRHAWDRIDRTVVAGAARLTPRASEAGPASIECGVVAHAPYSVSPELFRCIAGARRQVPLSVHVGESAEEIEFLLTGTGPIRQLLEDLGVWTDDWDVPRCDPVEYLRRVNYLSAGCLVVHGVHLHSPALERLREEDAVVVTCPRSNEWVGAGMPPVSHFYGAGLRVAVGTDSLASVGSLNLFDELAALRRIAPEVSAASLLESATRIGADALGQGRAYGTIAPGKRAALVSVRLPNDVVDVEEYLVGGLSSDDIRPLDVR